MTAWLPPQGVAERDRDGKVGQGVAILPPELGRPGPWRLLGRAAPTLLLAALAAGCGQLAANTSEKKPIEVIVTTPVRGEVTDYQDFTGRLDGIKTVDIRPRVSGFVVSAPFKEGDLVHEGDLLFEIDPRTYQADLNLAAANFKLAKADQYLQQKVTARARALVQTRAMSQEDYDTSVATMEKSQATVAAMGATQDRAQLYLDYTHVIAPLSGRISRRFVDPGNLVNADNTILTTVVSDSQLYAYFDVDERTYLDLVGQRSSGQSSWLQELRFPVLMRLANEEQFTHSGSVDFIDNRVNASTGTIRMRAVFDNSPGLLRAGLFVRIRLPIGSPYQTLLIPDEALLSDQGRHYVYVVTGENKVDYRAVTLGQEVQGLRVIKQGLSPGEQIIVSGLQRVRPKAEVQVKKQDPPKPPDSPLGRLLGARFRQGDKETRRQGENEAGKPEAGLNTPGG
jgi:RND family efflux transporter MFP subunit